MRLARVEGSVTATVKHPSLNGWRMLIVQHIGHDGAPVGVPEIGIDQHGANPGELVITSADGAALRHAVGDPKSPARIMVIGIVDRDQK